MIFMKEVSVNGFSVIPDSNVYHSLSWAGYFFVLYCKQAISKACSCKWKMDSRRWYMTRLAKERKECDFAPYLAEFVATLVFVFIGAGSIINGLDGPWVALAHGGAIALMVAAIANVSGGHINPMVTWAVMVRGVWKRDFDFRKGIGYIIAQLAGAAAGAGILLGLAYLTDGGKATADAVNFGTPGLKEGLDPIGGFILEALFGFLLVFVILRTAVEQKLVLAPFAIGGAIFLGALAGHAFNPARWFGPALTSGTWDNAWIYVLAPMLGATIAVIMNDLISRRKNHSSPA